MAINFQDVSYTYQSGTPFEGRALFDVDLDIKDNSYTAFISIQVQENQQLCNC